MFFLHKHLQYKMFLLNLYVDEFGRVFTEFTIQNVPIKSL